MSKAKDPQSIEAKIAELQSELKAAKREERRAAREAERREKERRQRDLVVAAERSGLLAVYGDAAALERAFTALAGRMKSGIATDHTQEDSADEQPQAFRTTE